MPPTKAVIAGLAALLGLLAAAPAVAQEREVEIGPAGAQVFEAPEAGAPVIRDVEPGMRARALSRQFGYYKVRIGKRGQVGWVRISDTVVPKVPPPGPAGPNPTPRGPNPAPPPAAPAVAGPARAPAPARAPLGKPGKAGKPAKGFEVIRAETVTDGGTTAAEAGAATEEHPASRPARRPAAPLVPPLRWAWPPPLTEWGDTTRAWATTLDSVHLGVAGALALLAVALLLYLGYRLVKAVVLVPVQALRALGRRLGAAARRRREAPKVIRPEVQGRLDEIQGLAAAVQATGAAEISLHEVFVASGADDAAMSALVTVAAAEEARTDFAGWIPLLSAEDPIPLGSFLRAYLLEVIWTRAVTFLDLHPGFGGRGLRTERQEGDQESDIAFQFVSADGLGVNLDEEQQRVYLYLNTAIERARVHLPNPYAVASFARSLAEAAVPAASGDEPGEAAPAAAPPPAAAATLDDVPPLTVLLFGAAPFQHAGHFASGSAIPREVGEALMLHMRAGKEIRYGPAHYAARSGVQPAVGVALVGALSGAMSPAAATLKLRQALGAQPGAPVTVACATLGTHVESWLGAGNGRQREALRAAVARALGQEHLDRTASQADALLGLHGRDLDADAHRRLGHWEKVSLPQALLHTHATEVRLTREAVAAAADRYLEMLATLCERPDERVGLAPVGYLCAGLGAAAFADATDAMKVQVATAARTLRRAAPARDDADLPTAQR